MDYYYINIVKVTKVNNLQKLPKQEFYRIIVLLMTHVPHFYTK